MSVCLGEMYRVLRPGGSCILVLGDVEREGQTKRTAEILAELAQEVTHTGFAVETIYDDFIPDDRRSRRKTKTTKFERILIMRK
jgi:ubiquinone/menaquinone biosynthesis C-methylase UbiE